MVRRRPQLLQRLSLTDQVLIVLDSDPRSANAGVWCTMFFIYMTYTLLALHVEECTVSGLLLGFTQVACAAGLNYTDNFLIKQVRRRIKDIWWTGPDFCNAN